MVGYRRKPYRNHTKSSTNNVKRHPEAIHPEHVYTLDGLSAAVGASRRTIRGWIRQGLPASKNGQKTFIVGSDFADWVKQKRVKK